MGGGGAQLGFPKPGPVIVGIMAVNLVAYVAYLVLIRAGFGFTADLALTPRKFFSDLYLWQPLTAMVLHSPTGPGHLLMNMLWLYFFGTQMERWWGTRRSLTAYVVFGLSGAALTLLVGSLSLTGVFGTLLDRVYDGEHIGASGAVMGIVVAWGIVHADRTMQFFLLGAMKGRTFILIVVAFELLAALSLSNVSSTSHFGGMIGAVVLCNGLYKPQGWKKLFRRESLKKEKRRIEHQLRVIQGGGGTDPDDPSTWN